MAILRTKVKGRAVIVELTIDELEELLRRQLIPNHSPARASLATRQVTSRRTETAAEASQDFATAVRRAWPEGLELVNNPELTTGNVRRFLIQRVLSGAMVTSTGEVAVRFFGRPLVPTNPADAADLRRLWYCIREAKRDIEEAVGGRWEDATDAPVRAGSSRAWRLVPSIPADSQTFMAAYRESR